MRKADERAKKLKKENLELKKVLRQVKTYNKALLNGAIKTQSSTFNVVLSQSIKIINEVLYAKRSDEVQKHGEK